MRYRVKWYDRYNRLFTLTVHTIELARFRYREAMTDGAIYASMTMFCDDGQFLVMGEYRA